MRMRRECRAYDPSFRLISLIRRYERHAAAELPQDAAMLQSAAAAAVITTP